MTRACRRFAAAAILVAMTPLAAIASICAAHCEAEAVAVAIVDGTASAPAGDEPCVGTALCLFANGAIALPDAGDVASAFLLAEAAPHVPGPSATPAEPHPPPVPPRTAA